MSTIEFKVGLFVLICLGIIAAMSFRVNTDPGLTGRVKRYSVILPNASGLVKNSEVKMAGIPVGVIKDIVLEGGKADLKMTVRGDIKLTKSSVVEIQPNGILGDKHIEIAAGDPADPVLEDGAVITTFRDRSGMDAVLNQVSKITSDISTITENLRKATDGQGDDTSPVGRIIHNIEDLTADLREVSKNHKADLSATLANLHEITDNLNDFIGDDSEDGFKHNWKKMAKSLGKVEDVIKNVDEITAKINDGKGTIGKLVNDETTVDEVNRAVASINGMMDTANKLQVDLDYHSELLAGAMTKTYIGVNIQPGPDRYYMLQLIDDPKGSYDRQDSLVTSGGTTTTTDTQNVYHNKMKFSAEFAKNFYNFTLRAGVIENSGGAGLDYSLFNKKLRLTTEAFNFSRQEGVDVRAYARYRFWSVFYAVAGGDDIMNTKGNSFTGTGASGFVGAGLDFSNDDLKLLLAKVPF